MMTAETSALKMLLAFVGLATSFAATARAQEYDVILETIRINPVKGYAEDYSEIGWDFANSLPDPYVQVGTSTSGVKQSSTKSDTIRASYSEKLGRVRKGDKLVFQVKDKDLVRDDFIGFYETRVSARMLSEEFYDFRFDKVTELKIRFRRR